MKVRLWVSLLAISMLVAVALAVVLLRGATGSTATNTVLTTFIDTNTGDGICDLPPDSSRTVAHPASFDVAVCVENPTAAPALFSFDLVYDDIIIRAPEVANSGTALDDNPDANQAALGTGWDCSGYGMSYPTGDTDAATGVGHGRAKIGCMSLSGPWTLTSTGYLALVHFSTQGIEGSTSLGLEWVSMSDKDANEIGSCNPDVSVPMPCVDGNVTVTGGAPTPTYTPTPTASATPTNSPTPTITPTPRPFACLWEDDYGRDTSLGIKADMTSSWVFMDHGVVVASGPSSRRFATSRVVTGQSNGVNVFGVGKCPEGPGRANALVMSVFPFRVLRLVDVSK